MPWHVMVLYEHTRLNIHEKFTIYISTELLTLFWYTKLKNSFMHKLNTDKCINSAHPSLNNCKFLIHHSQNIMTSQDT